MDFIKNTIYHIPKPPPRVRTKPLQLICVGLPRSATESLSIALRKLGLTTYHGWDIVFEQDPGYIKAWSDLAKRKFNGAPDGDIKITTAEFDALIGHCDAVVDTAASFFASELIKAYPDAKVVLNTRKDLDAWHRSVTKTILEEVEDRWFIRAFRLFSPPFFWLWEFYVNNGLPGLFRSPYPGTVRAGIMKNGKWVYREHSNMIRGLVPKERLLEWSVEDGWGPLCEFLDKTPPDEPFPRVNDPVGFARNVELVLKPRYKEAIRNLVLTMSSVAVLTTAIVLGVKEGGIPWQTITWIRNGFGYY